MKIIVTCIVMASMVVAAMPETATACGSIKSCVKKAGDGVAGGLAPGIRPGNFQVDLQERINRGLTHLTIEQFKELKRIEGNIATAKEELRNTFDRLNRLKENFETYSVTGMRAARSEVSARLDELSPRTVALPQISTDFKKLGTSVNPILWSGYQALDQTLAPAHAASSRLKNLQKKYGARAIRLRNEAGDAIGKAGRDISAEYKRCVIYGEKVCKVQIDISFGGQNVCNSGAATQDDKLRCASDENQFLRSNLARLKKSLAAESLKIDRKIRSQIEKIQAELSIADQENSK